MALPTLVYASQVKTGNEVAIYYNFGVGRIKKNKTSANDVTVTACSGSETCPAGSFDATVLTSVLGTTQSAFGDMPANSPLYTAVEGEHTPADIGVNADLVCLPNPDDDQLLCFDRSFSASPGTTFKPIMRKFNSADHYVRQRGDNTLSLTDLLISNRKGLRSIYGRRVTIIAKIYPQGGGSLQELIYFSNVILNMPPIAYSNDGNAEIEISAEGSYQFCAVFSAAVV